MYLALLATDGRSQTVSCFPSAQASAADPFLSCNVGAPWIGPVVFFGICNFAIVLGTTAGVSYIVDCNRHTTDAALGALIFWVGALSSLL